MKRYTELKTYHSNYKGYVQYSVSGCYNDMNCRGDYTTGDSVDRFAELENKLEDGTLIDVRFKLGQHVFMPGFFKGEFDEYIVDNITLDHGELSFHFKHAEDAGCTCYSTTILHTEDLWKVFTSVEDFEEWAKKREEENKDGRE